jgi:FKBP-type peptidyl-prolyl cis-trans isomerase FklB
MKQLFFIPAMALVVGCNNTKTAETVVNLEDESSKLSYSLGVLYGQDYTESKENLDFLLDSVFLAGFKDAMASKTKIDMETAKANLDAHFATKRDAEVNKALEEGKVFFEQNASREGVVETASGLQYEVLVAGKGNMPQPTDRVKVHYHGTLLDGSVFDSSVQRGEPVTFGVTEVIPGWTEVLQLMPVGSKWKVYIPFNLAYGAQGAGPIQPYSSLVFEIDLIGIEK